MNLARLASAETVAISVTREEYARGYFDDEELERRLDAITGRAGAPERERVLSAAETVDVTSFGSPVIEMLAVSWEWPE